MRARHHVLEVEFAVYPVGQPSFEVTSAKCSCGQKYNLHDDLDAATEAHVAVVGHTTHVQDEADRGQLEKPKQRKKTTAKKTTRKKGTAKKTTAKKTTKKKGSK
jgi:hypothetical protein